LNGFELCQRILEVDLNVKVCFVTAGEINEQALRELYPNIGMDCFIQKPVTIDYLSKRLLAELD
jgi:DNA-binding response OmpR family regulator